MSPTDDITLLAHVILHPTTGLDAFYLWHMTDKLAIGCNVTRAMDMMSSGGTRALVALEGQEKGVLVTF